MPAGSQPVSKQKHCANSWSMMTLIFEGLCSSGRKWEDRREGEGCEQWGEKRVMCTAVRIISCTLAKVVGAFFLPLFFSCGAVSAVINIIIKALFLSDNPYEKQNSLKHFHVCATGIALERLPMHAYKIRPCQPLNVQWTLDSIGACRVRTRDKGNGSSLVWPRKLWTPCYCNYLLRHCLKSYNSTREIVLLSHQVLCLAVPWTDAEGLGRWHCWLQGAELTVSWSAMSPRWFAVLEGSACWCWLMWPSRQKSQLVLLIFFRNSLQKYNYFDSTSCSASVVGQESWKTTQMSSCWKRKSLFPFQILHQCDRMTLTIFPSFLFSVMNILKSLTSSSWRMLVAAQRFWRDS